MTFTDLHPAICQVEGCNREATDPHHMKSKARGGSDDPINKKWICRECHTVITTHDGEWTMRWRTFQWQEEGVTEYDFYVEYPEYYDQCYTAEYGMGYSKARQLGRTE